MKIIGFNSGSSSPIMLKKGRTQKRTSTPLLYAVLIVFQLTLSACDNPASDDNGNAVYSVEVKEPVRVLEGTNLTFVITRQVDLSNKSTVSYEFSGDATYGEDFSDPNELSVAFAAGQSSVEIRLETTEDEETEEEESVVITLRGASDGRIDPEKKEATGYIRDGGPSCVGPEGTTFFVNFDDITGTHGPTAGDATRLSDGYHGFIWGDWMAKDDIPRSQDETHEPGRGWYEGIVSAPNAIYPRFGAQPGSVSVIERDEPFVLKSFHMSALSADNLPVTLRYFTNGRVEVGRETFVVSRREKALIEPDTDIMYVNCIKTIAFNQPVLGAGFMIDDMTFIH